MNRLLKDGQLSSGPDLSFIDKVISAVRPTLADADADAVKDAIGKLVGKWDNPYQQVEKKVWPDGRPSGLKVGEAAAPFSLLNEELAEVIWSQWEKSSEVTTHEDGVRKASLTPRPFRRNCFGARR